MIPYGRHYIDAADVEAVSTILISGQIAQGPAIEKFEQELASKVGARYAVAVSSGTAGLHIAAKAAGLCEGKTLYTSPITFVATANAARYVEAEVKTIDINLETVNMDIDAIDGQAIDAGEGSVIAPVHFGGLACDMSALSEIAKKKGCMVIEDAAHALGARYANGQPVGCCSHSDMTVFSMHPVKAISAGEGGVVTTNNETLYKKLLRSRSHGITKTDDHFENSDQALTEGEINPWYYEMQELGFHYRLSDINCSLALSQLAKLDMFMDRRRALAERYDELLSDLKNVKPFQKGLRKNSGNHLYVVGIDFEKSGKGRAVLMRELKSRGIGSQVHYIPLDNHPYYRRYGLESKRVSSLYYSQCLSIPIYYSLTEREQDMVVTALKELVG